MRKWLHYHRRRIVAGGALLLTVGLCWVSSQEQQPVYGGKRILDYFPGWIPRIGAQPKPGMTLGVRMVVPIMSTQPSQNLAYVGPEAIPWLLRVIRKEDSALKRFFLKYSSRLPIWLQRVLPAPIAASSNWENACQVLANTARRNSKEIIPMLGAVLEAGTARERVAAARALISVGPDAAMAQRALNSILFYDDPTVRLRIDDIDNATILAMTTFWIKQRGTGGPEFSSLAQWFCRVMLDQGPRARTALPALVVLRTNANPEVRVEAIYAAWRIDPTGQSCGPELLHAFNQPTGEARHLAGDYLARDAALMNLPPVETVSVMRQTLRGQDAALRTKAALILVPFKADALSALPELRIALRDANRELRLAAAQAIEAIGPAASDLVSTLVEALKDPAAQGIVARILGSFGPKAASANPRLVELLSDASEFVGSTELRCNAARALGRIGGSDASVLAALRKAADDRNPFVADAASAALQQIASTGREALPER